MEKIVIEKYNRLTVLEIYPLEATNKSRKCLCKCDCGIEKIQIYSNVKSGSSKSCGCLRTEKTKERYTKHGGSRTIEYISWKAMIFRCYNKNSIGWKDYGGRGIEVSDKWRHDFQAFLDDVGYRPSIKYSLDRINNNGNYEPGNVKWSTRSEQQQNRNNNRWITFKDTTKVLADWVKIVGISKYGIYRRLKEGWTVEEAFTTPPRKPKGIYPLSEKLANAISK